MKSIAVMVAAIFGFLFATANISHADTLTLCADQGKFGARPGYKITGINANFTDWQTNKILGDIIGDGNCQSGWTMHTDIDPRIEYGSTAVYDDVVVGTETVTNTKTVFDGRVTSAYNGTAPDVLKGRRAGAADKWKLVSRDGNGGGIYRVVKPGNTSRSKGTKLYFTSDMLVARDNQSGNATTNPYWHRNFRYDQFKDVTTSHDVDVMGKQRRVVSRTFCPSVYTWIMISPSGEAVASTQGYVAPCIIKKY
jgi:hypothetical protein